MKQYHYVGKDGQFDYDLYVSSQVRANKKKIEWQWTTQPAIKFIAKNTVRVLGEKPKYGICHGTRRGLEQAWFEKAIPGCDVIGTEISDTAKDFPKTIEWDFHKPKSEWLDHFDFVYSNSWDHSFDPYILFNTWMGQLRWGGVMVLEHTRSQWKVNQSDPLGMTIKQLTQLLEAIGQGKWELVEILKGGPRVGQCWKEEGYEAQYPVVRRAK
jgi:hypothetical protein